MYFMDAFGPSISLLPLNGLSLDISKTYVCSATPHNEHTATIEAGDYFILCNFMIYNSTVAFGTTYIYIMSSSNSNKVYYDTDTFFYFKNTTTIAAKISSTNYTLNLSLIKINS